MKFTALVAAAVLAAPAIAAPLLSPRQAVCDAGAICPAAEGEVSTESVGVVPSGQQWVVYDDATEDPAVVYDYAGEIAVPWTTLLDQGLETFNRTYSYTGVNGEVRITLPGTTKVSTWSALAVGEPVQSLAASPSAQIDNPDLLFSVSFNSTLARDRGEVSLYCGTELYVRALTISADALAAVTESVRTLVTASEPVASSSTAMRPLLRPSSSSTSRHCVALLGTAGS